MSARDQMLTLQWMQLKHDESYHKDIMILSPGQRVKHMALHNAKYTAYFLHAIETSNEDRFLQTLVDAFIIAIATANALNQNLGGELVGANSSPTVNALGYALAKQSTRAGDRKWIVWEFIRHNGMLSKLCESLDHLEPLPFRQGMKECNLSLLQSILIEASASDIDLICAYKTRIRDVESRSMFDSYFRDGAGGEA